jgi:hypothetical protein
VLPLVQQYSWAIDLQICVFPQEGLLNNPGTDELMVEALERGCRAIGRRALYRQQIRLVARRPREVASPITNGGTLPNGHWCAETALIVADSAGLP